VTAEDDILVGRLAADLSGARRVDLCICDGLGVEQVRLEDIPVSRALGSVVVQESITFMKAAPSLTMLMRLVNVDEAGNDRRSASTSTIRAPCNTRPAVTLPVEGNARDPYTGGTRHGHVA
jgi:hypothetical protein